MALGKSPGACSSEHTAMFTEKTKCCLQTLWRGKGKDRTDHLHLVMRGFLSKLKTKSQVLITVIFLRMCCVPGIVLSDIPPFEGGDIVSMGFEMRKEVQGH